MTTTVDFEKELSNICEANVVLDLATGDYSVNSPSESFSIYDLDKFLFVELHTTIKSDKLLKIVSFLEETTKKEILVK